MTRVLNGDYNSNSLIIYEYFIILPKILDHFIKSNFDKTLKMS